jgi:hypothetical protein
MLFVPSWNLESNKSSSFFFFKSEVPKNEKVEISTDSNKLQCIYHIWINNKHFSLLHETSSECDPKPHLQRISSTLKLSVVSRMKSTAQKKQSRWRTERETEKERETLNHHGNDEESFRRKDEEEEEEDSDFLF